MNDSGKVAFAALSGIGGAAAALAGGSETGIFVATPPAPIPSLADRALLAVSLVMLAAGVLVLVRLRRPVAQRA